jgi:fructokinase
MPRDPLAPPDPDALVVGTGRLTLDVIRAGPSRPVRWRAGGTCGNVLADLAYLGWPSYPIIRLGDDPAGRYFAHDLARWGVSLDFVRHDEREHTPVVIHHIGEGPQGEPVHSFSSKCPFCEAPLPGSQPVAVDLAREAVARLPVPKVFFFDRPSEGSLLLARAWAERGALVVFEPNHPFEPALFEAALATTHLLKFSHQRLRNLAEVRPLREPLLVVETQGPAGLRYRDQRAGGGDWQHLEALPAPAVRDSAGCGDWCTAGLIHAVGQGGRAGLDSIAGEDLRAALRVGQALGAWNCGFEGARGGMYLADRSAFEQSIGAILAGDAPAGLVTAEEHDEPALSGSFCPACAGHADCGRADAGVS